MKQVKDKNNRKSKPFLVLPLIVQDNLEKDQDSIIAMPVKKPALNLFTKTWPPKTNKKKDERPLTATLEKPMILDIRLIGKIDMSKVRKEFLNISNLCRIPLVINNKKMHIPLSLPPAENRKKKKTKVSELNDSGEDDESTSVRSSISKTKSCRVKKIRPFSHSEIKCDDNNNNKISGGNVTKECKPLQKVVTVPGARLLSTSTNSLKSTDCLVSNKSTKLPIPTETCRSCGRKDRPERFHTHINTSSSPTKEYKVTAEHPIPSHVKGTVQKPLAIKYKSKAITSDTKKSFTIRKPTMAVSKSARNSPPHVKETNNVSIDSESKPIASSRAGSAKRTLTCYICGREFGSASLPLHEPKCLQKWERENSSLPAHLRRIPPSKPDHSLNKEEWDKLAWESSQSILTPCQKCGRTFYPDRLVVHQRSCKTTPNHLKVLFDANMGTAGPPDAPARSPRPPPTYDCYICGKQFGANSIAVHERQCLKKWNTENDSLPPDMRSPPPVKKEKSSPQETVPKQSPVREDTEKEERPTSSRKPPLFPCYICGKLFTVNSIYIHEPQCLKMWKIENEKLPPSKRRPQPLKPDIKFTRNGNIDYDTTVEANWRSHLNQLVPCKNCARTFNAERVEIHERNCKGN